MKFRYSDHLIEGSTTAAIVVLMRERSFSQTRTIREYMSQVADRAKVQTGKEVRYDSTENFVADLVSAGLLEEVVAI